MCKTTQEKIAVMQAFVDGRRIEYFHNGKWWECTNVNPKWDWKNTEYRIKPEKVKVFFVKNENTGFIKPMGEANYFAYKDSCVCTLVKQIEVEI